MNLDSKLSSIKGVGPKTAEKLALAGFSTVGDVIDFLPRTYEDYSEITPIAKLRPGKVTVRARVEKVSTRNIRWRMCVTTATLSDDSGKVQAVWFNQYYRETQFKNPNDEFYFSGEFGFKNGRYQITSPSAEAVKDLPVQTGRVLPIYPATKGLKPSLTRSVLDKLRPVITMLPETLPDEIIKEQKLLPRDEAMLGLHFPESKNQADCARERLAFEELFELLLASRLNKQENSKLKGFHIPFDQVKIKEFVSKLPFKLTNSQRRALWDILCDFEKPIRSDLIDSNKGDVPNKVGPYCNVTPMNRLLQGDVGSGKTVVAGVAAYQASLAGFQAAIMAPTEILATQHAETLNKLLTPFGVKVALLTGSVKGKARTELYKQIMNGKVDIVVGTHALFQKDVKFKKLGFVVIDEQHRFGVEQRQALLAKSQQETIDDRRLTIEKNCNNFNPQSSIINPPAMPHLLSMTATPIPRSLQLTLFGDLDISTLNDLPAGRKKIETKIWSPNKRAELYDVVRKQLNEGRQVYIVVPLIEESSATGSDPVAEKVAAETKYKEIMKVFSNRHPELVSGSRQDEVTWIPKQVRNDKQKRFKVGLLHGKLPSSEKEKVMKDFAEHKIDILVATTVVEVGVDVPNATVMLIENADRFGLAQLHQLRGRVGRGEHQSYCYLVPTESGRPTQRLKEVEKSNDGFYLSEVDLQLRGPGEIYGTMQHGDLNLRIASLADTRLIARVAKSAEWFMNNKTLDDYTHLQNNVIKYQRLTTLN